MIDPHGDSTPGSRHLSIRRFGIRPRLLGGDQNGSVDAMTDQDPAATPEEFGGYFTERVDRLNRAIEDFHIEVDLSSPDIAERYREVLADLHVDHERVDDFARRFGESATETWLEIRDAAERAYDRLEGDIGTAWADLRAEKAVEPHRYRAAVRAQAESWRTHLDRLKLHAKLGQMEARDALGGLDDAYQAAKPGLERASDAAGDAIEAVKEPARDLVAHLRKAAKDFSRSID